ncbi:MAG TPA: amino acid adenylation domain-containing protein [Herpetosiphonaceae bacterium]
MTTIELLDRLRALNITLWAEGDQLRFKAPKGALTDELRAALAAQKAEVLVLLQGAAVAAQDTPTSIPRIKRDARLPLSFAQQRLWFLDQLEPNSPLYNIPSMLRIAGPLDASVFERSFNALIGRHEILRTTFTLVEGQPIQVIAPPAPMKVSSIDLRRLPAHEREATARHLAGEEALQPFDLGRGPLLRITLIQLDDAEVWVLFTTHHTVFDGWSTGVLVGELWQLYRAFTRGEEPSLPELPIQYADYAVWQRRWLQGEMLERMLRYWKQQLGNEHRRGPVPLLELPTDHPRPSVQSNRGKSITFTLPQPLTDALVALSQREQVTLFMTLLTAFQVLLFRYSGQDDLAIGTPIANRNRRELEPLIGCFINTLVLRTDLSGNPAFRALLHRVRQTTLDAYDHQDLPFEVLVDALQPARDLSHNPLFQVMFVMQNTPIQALDLSEFQIGMVDLETRTAKTDVSLEIVPIGEILTGTFVYTTDLFDRPTIERILAHFVTLLEGVVAEPEMRITHLPLLTGAERQQMLIDWNHSAAECPGEAAIQHVIAAQAARTPDKTAIVFEAGTRERVALTYGELNRRANQLAHSLRDQGVGPEVLVGLYVEPSLELIVGMLAILKAGGAYVPLDPAYPHDHIQCMLQDAGIAILLTLTDLAERLPALQGRIICLDAESSNISRESEANLDVNLDPDTLAYVIYTSGSTGRPKGVLIPHRGLVNLARAQREAFAVMADSRVLQFAALSFDASIAEVAVTLTAGAQLELVPRATPLVGADLADVLDRRAITHVTLPPSVLMTLPEQPLPALQTLIVAGEACGPELAARWGPGRRFVNAYGPTETTVCATLEVGSGDGDLLPIGRPIANTQIYLLDVQLQPVPIGVPGELHIGGVGLARGYHQRPGLTAERFIPDPFSTRPGSRLYRTGDRARYLPDGRIAFLGRIDHQIKIRGFRVELGEIESVLRQHEAVRDALVLMRDERLVAYVVQNNEQRTENRDSADDCSVFSVRCSPQDLRTFLQSRLPAYMLPSAFVFLDALPRTPNGKLDRTALPVPGTRSSDTPGTFVAPRDTLEVRLARIWEALLGVQPVGICDNFFELGGHSLLVVRLMAQIQVQLGQKIPLATLFQEPTVEHLARTLRQQRTTPLDTPLIPLQPNGTKLPFFCAHPAAGSVLSYLELARLLGPDQPVYGVQAAGLADEQPPHTRVEDMAAACLAALRAAQPEGPYLLGGWSFGGLVAYEMACHLTAQGHQVGLLALLDSQAPTLEAPPSVDQTTLLQWFVGDLSRTFGTDLALSAEAVAAVAPEQRLHYVLEQARSAGMLLSDIDEHNISAYFDVFTASLEAMQSYRPRPYPGRVTLFRAGDRPLDAAGETLGWDALAADGVQVQVLPGDHYTILRQPHVTTLANQVRASLDEAQTLGDA